MIKSSEIQQAIEVGEPINSVGQPSIMINLGQHRLGVSKSVIELSKKHTIEIEQIVNESMRFFVREQTLVQAEIDKPTAIARVDCTISKEGILPYEFEDRPAGLGVDHLLHDLHYGIGNIDVVQDHVTGIFGAELVVVRHPDAYPCDDSVVLRVTENVSATDKNVILVRGEPHMFSNEGYYQTLASKSISTIRSEGDKSYELKQSIFSASEVKRSSDLPSKGRSFVLKRMQGSKAKGVALYLSRGDQKVHGTKGVTTYSKIQRILEAGTPYIIEDFKPPIRVAGMGNMILRVMAHVSADKTKITGGMYVVRPELIVHGASNCFAGKIKVEEA